MQQVRNGIHMHCGVGYYRSRKISDKEIMQVLITSWIEKVTDCHDILMQKAEKEEQVNRSCKGRVSVSEKDGLMLI